MSGQAPALYDANNRVIQPTAKPVAPIAAIGEVRNPFTTRNLPDEITPELVARIFRPGAPLALIQQVCKRVLRRDPKFMSAWRDYVLDVSGLDYEFVAKKKPLKREQSIAGKMRDYAEEVLNDLPIAKLVKHLVWGDYAPMSFAENQYDLPTRRLTGWEFVDAARQYWDSQTSKLKCLTINQPTLGEPLAPNMWIVHSTLNVPGDPLEAGTWPGVILRYCAKGWTSNDWQQFIHLHGKPWRLAFIKDPNLLETVKTALRVLGVDAAGVFPEGTDVRIEKFMTSGAAEPFEKLCARCDDEVSTLFTGHPLINTAVSGSGTLAGKGALKVNAKILRAGAIGVMDTFHRDVMQPVMTMKFGYEQTLLYAPYLKLKYEPPVDKLNQARAHALVNEKLLRPLKKAIAVEQVQEEYGIANVVDLPEEPQPLPPGAPGNEGDPASDDEADVEASMRAPRGRKVAAAAAPATTPLNTLEDVVAVSTAVGQRAFAESGAAMHAIVDDGATFKEMIAEIWEQASGRRKTKRKLANALHGAIRTSNYIGRSDVDADS